LNIIRLTNSFPSVKKLAGLPDTYDISREQVSLGHRVFVISKRLDQNKEYEKMNGIDVFRVKSPYNLFAFKKISGLEKKYPLSVLHSHATACQYLPFLKNFLGGNRVKHLVHVHGTTRGIVNSLKLIEKNEDRSIRRIFINSSALFRESLVWNNADALIAVSESVKSELGKLYGIKMNKIFIVNNGVNTDLFHSLSSRENLLKELGYSSNTNLILYLGWFRAIKGADVLVRALDIVKKRSSNLKVMLVSGPISAENNEYSEKVLSLINSLGLNQIVDIQKTIPFHDLPKLYNAAKAVVVPSIHESFPKVPLEAMACGTPVIGSNVGGIPQILADGSGIIVRPMNIEDLSQAIIEIISNKTLSKEIGNLGRDRIMHHFSWKDKVNEIMKVYNKVYYAA